ncbi:MAG: elongation factor Ts [Candidatus Parcubacteria bacterium]|nr:MAG: elongation factor Ts [Candidatus Parcubacteria bacterium]
MDKELLEKIKLLREQTGAPIGKCKEALEKEKGDIEKAKILLRKIGENLLDKKKEIVAGNGIIEGYIHFNGRVGSLIELRSETDFVAKSPDFKNLAHQLALQIATMKPLYIDIKDIPQDILESKKDEFSEDIKDKPGNIKDQIIQGRINKWAEEICLLQQPYFKDENIKIKDLINEYTNKFGEKIEVKRFIRFSVDD